MKIFIIELLEEFGEQCQVAHISSTLVKAKRWIKTEGLKFGGFNGSETHQESKYMITSEVIDSKVEDLSDFKSYGWFTVNGEEVHN